MSDDTLAEQVLAALGAVPDVGDTFQREGLQGTEYYRVSSWLKRRPPRKPDPDPRMEEFLRELEVKCPRAVAGPDRVPLMFCLRHEAEYVSGRGVGGVIMRVRDVVVTGHVSLTFVDGERETANRLAGEPLV